MIYAPIRISLLRLGLLLILCASAMPCLGQRTIYKNYTIEDGLPQSQVHDILQDARGYLWFSTNGGGASYFDGRRFTPLAQFVNDVHRRIVYDLLEDR